MTRTYRDIAIEDMVRTVEEAMSRVIDYWGDLPAPMKDSIEQFRTCKSWDVIPCHGAGRQDRRCCLVIGSMAG